MTDVVLLTHDRLGHLVRTVEALRARTHEPIRLTVVDNASGPDVRNWLAAHRDWFHRVIPRPANEHVPAFQHGIDATESDPFVVTDPDLVVPDLEPSWLARLRDLMQRHPEFGLIGVELDPSNSPLSAEETAALRQERRGGGDLREGNVGTHLQLIRRDALREPYRSDRQVCDAVRRAGYRVGWAPEVQALHLGFEDAKAHPEYLRRKDARGEFYPSYANVLRTVERRPSLRALAGAAPVIAATRAAGVPDHEVVDRTGTVAGVVPGVRDAGEGEALVVDDPAEVRPVGRVVILVATLEDVDARLADDLAPPGWRGEERPAVGDGVVALAEAGDLSPVLRGRLGLSPLEHREDWLRLLAAGAFGATARRLFVFTPQ